MRLLERVSGTSRCVVLRSPPLRALLCGSRVLVGARIGSYPAPQDMEPSARGEGSPGIGMGQLGSNPPPISGSLGR
jgi:hypothetical protein